VSDPRVWENTVSLVDVNRTRQRDGWNSHLCKEPE